MKLSTLFLNVLVATKLVTSLAVFSISAPTLPSPDWSQQSLVKEAASFLDHFSRNNNPQTSPFHSLSIRSPQNDDSYPSAEAEAIAEGLSGGFRTIPTSPSSRRNFNIAHGTLMTLTFTLWFPLGAIIMHTTHKVWLHAAVQSFAYINAIAGMGLGIWLGRNVRYLDYAHTVIGMAVMAALVFQVALGVWTHRRIVAEKERGKEAPVRVTRMRKILTRGFLHRWLGRSLVALGIIDGGLGLKLAQNTTGGKIAYGIVAGLVGVAYLTLLLFRTWRRYHMTKEEPIAPQGGMLT